LRHTRINLQAVAVLLWSLGATSRAGAQAAGPADSSGAVTTAPAAPAVSPPKPFGYIQARETWQEHIGFTATLNRARIGVEGALPSHFNYRVLVEFEAAAGKLPSTPSLRDAYIRWSHAPWSIWAGQYKTPFSREYITSITAIETADRSTVVDSLATKRDIGVMGDVAIGPYANLAAGVFNGEGQNASSNRDSTVLFVSRATARPLPQLTVGGSFARFGPDSLRWGAEAHVEQSGVILRYEYIAQHRLGIDKDDYGWYGLGAWRAVQWLQLVAKQEDFQRPYIGDSRRMRGTTLGANVDFPGGRTRMIVDWVVRKNGVALQRRDQGIAQLQVKF